MLKRDIKKIIEEMEIDEEVLFQCNDINGWRIDRVKRRKDDYTIFSKGQCWIDQMPTIYNPKQVLKIIWSEKPYSYTVL